MLYNVQTFANLVYYFLCYKKTYLNINNVLLHAGLSYLNPPKH